MDDIYGDLENYNDANVIDELRNENKELKFKLEEYGTAMAKLQNDFDKVSSEFKKLEINYSSLLKTAKAEVERKTQIITNLNVEKDMLVLSSLQNSNKSLLVLRRNMARERSNNCKSRKDDTDSGKTIKKEQLEMKKHETERPRNDENRLPSVDTASTGNTDDINKHEILDSYDKTSESKENIAKGKKALSLKNRRKSVPVLSKLQAKFSSDEEYEDDCSVDGNKRERPPREDKSRKYFDRHKISETSGIDEKYSSYHESSRDTYYKGKPNRPSDKFRNNRDKSRHRKHFSPEKVRRSRDFHEDDRQEMFRHNRVLVSPPRDSYDAMRMVRERRSNYDRVPPHEERYVRRDDFEDRHMRRENFHEDRRIQRDDYREERNSQRYGFHEDRRHQGDSPFGERNRQRGTSQEERRKRKSASHERRKERDKTIETRPKQKDGSNKKRQRDELHEGKQNKITHVQEEINGSHQEKVAKLKTDSDYDEPSSKRARIESSSKPVDEPVICPEEPQIVQDKLLPAFAEHLHYTSCQSPDDPHRDTQPLPTALMSITPKEIMSTAATTLEDPRLKSKKYVKEIEDNKTVLKTVIGRNVDLRPVDKLAWEIPQVEVPKALQQPLQYEIVQDLHTDAVSNTSFDSGEIDSESNDLRMADYISLNFNQDYENERINQIEAKADKEPNNAKNKKYVRVERDSHPKLEQSDKERPINIDERKLPPVKYKLSQAFIPETKKEHMPHPLENLLNQMRTVSTPSEPPEAKLNNTATTGPDGVNKAKKDVEVESTQVRQLRGRKLSAQEIVEGDLALSDEACDNVYMRRQKKKETLKLQISNNNKADQKKEVDVKKAAITSLEKSDEKKSRTPKTDNEISSQKVEEIKTDDTTEMQPDEKNKKTRKKSAQKQKTTSAKEIAKTENTEKLTETKTKSKKSKSPKETKDLNKATKFTDLFGESSSLITPEDLGMVTEIQAGKARKYVPICEDAQDAIDVNVNDINKKEIEAVQSLVTSSKVDDKTPTSLICKISLPESTSTKNEKSKATVPIPPSKIPSTSEVLNKEVTKEPDVIKTVIISTGIQPRRDPELENNVVDNENIDSPATIPEVQVPVALATSTPHKNLLLQLEAQIERNSSRSSETQNDTSSANQSAMSNGLSEAHADDAPDIRIFVKRRKRVKK